MTHLIFLDYFERENSALPVYLHDANFFVILGAGEAPCSLRITYIYCFATSVF